MNESSNSVSWSEVQPTRKKITVVLPTIERNHLLKKTVAFWLANDFRVIVVDGSKFSLEGKIPDRGSEYGSLRIIHMPGASIESRLHAATSMVDTEFCLWSPDDELCIPQTIDACIREMEERNLVGCYGNTLLVRRKWGLLALKQGYPILPRLEDSPRERSEAMMRRYISPILWTPFRTKPLLRAAEVMTYIASEHGAVSELTHCMAMLSQGRIGTIPEIYRLRNAENPNVWRPYADRDKNLKSVWEEKPWIFSQIETRIESLAYEVDPKASDRNWVLDSLRLYIEGSGKKISGRYHVQELQILKHFVNISRWRPFFLFVASSYISKNERFQLKKLKPWLSPGRLW